MSRRKTLTPYLSDRLRDRVTRYCAATGTTISQFAETAFEEFLDQTSDRTLLLKRLGRIEKKAGRLLKLHSRDTGIVLDLLGAFILNWFAHSPEVNEDHRATARQNAHKRLEEFQEYVARQINGPHRFLKELVEEPVAEEGELERAARPLDADMSSDRPPPDPRTDPPRTSQVD